MSSDLFIRIASLADLEQVTKLYSFLNRDDPFPPEQYSRDIWEKMMSREGVSVLLGEKGGRAVTTCTLVVVPNLTRGGRSWAVIENIVTLPELRKQGLGTAMLAEAVRRAREANCYKVVLTTGSKRESTLAFYEKAGFGRNTRTVFEQRF